MPKISTDHRAKCTRNFLDSVHIQGSTTDKNIAEHVLNNLKNIILTFKIVADKLIIALVE